jgi:WD40 repeat protein
VLDVTCISNTQVACSTSDMKIRLYSIETGTPICLFSGHTDRISQICSIEGLANVIYSVSEDGTVQIWDTRTQKVSNKIIVGSPLYSVDFNSDENLIAAGGASKVYLWDVMGNKKGTYEDSHTDEVTHVKFHLSTKELYSCGLDGLLSTFDYSLGESADDTYISGLNLDQPLSKFGFFGNDTNNFYSISTNETLFIGNTQQDKFITFPNTFREQLGEMGHTQIISLVDCIYFRNVDQLLLFCSSVSGQVDMFTINGYDVTLIGRLPENGHTDAVRAVYTTPNREIIITGGDDGLLCYWNNKKVVHNESLKIARPKSYCKNFKPY